jgi:hypothetical protein
MSQESLPERKTFKVVLRVYEDKACDFLIYRNRLQKMIEKYPKIPSKTIKKLLSFIRPESSENNRIFYSKAEELSTETITYFKKQRHNYCFEMRKFRKTPENEALFIIPDLDEFVPNCSHRNIKGGREILYSLEHLIYQVFRDMLTNRDNRKLIENKNKRKAFALIRSIVHNYCEKVMTGKKKHSNYKQCVISGYIAHKLGLLKSLHEFNDIDYNDYLYQRFKRVKLPRKKAHAIVS